MPSAPPPFDLPPLVEALYDSVARPEDWQAALGGICATFDGVLAVMATADLASRRAQLSAAWGPPEVLAPILADGASGLPFYPGMSALELDQPVTVDMLYALQGPGTRAAWLGSRMNLDWAVPNGLDDFFWVALMKEPARIGSLIVVTPTGRAPITPAELSQFAALAPHVRRAATIAELIEGQRRQLRAFQAVLEALSAPTVIVAADMRILYANPAAQAWLAQDGTAAAARGGTLRLRWPPAETAVAACVRAALRDETVLGGAGINVPLARAVRPAVAHVLPLARRDAAVRGFTDAAAAIFIAEAGAHLPAAIDAFAALFGLTAAERRVAAQVAQGLTRQEIAQASGVSDGTVKSQLATIYDKTGTGDQRALNDLIHDLSPPVRTPPRG